MIITQFKGRLGNQLFEYAAARKFAIDGNTELKLDLRNYRGIEDAHRIRFFNIIENVATEEECERLKRKDFLYYLEKVLPYYRRRFVWERDWLFDENLVGLKRKNMYVRGQFQSYKYFKGIEEVIRQEFTLKEPQSKEYQEIASSMKACNSISMLVRRSDFVTEVIDTYYECPPEHFQKGAEIIAKKSGTPTVFIFSEDMEWVKQNIRLPYPTRYMDQIPLTDYQTLMLMSCSKHNVISNSTFAWWGAWLNANPDKVVVAPKTWFRNALANARLTDNLIPPEWIKI